MEVSALNMKPSITPNMRSVVAPCILDATRITSADVRIAPTNAAVTTVSPDNAAGNDVPISKVATAAPVPAPALTPIMCGSASGFLKRPCIWSPARDRDAPASKAVSIRGSLSFKNITESGTPNPAPPTIRSAVASASTKMPATIVFLDDGTRSIGLNQANLPLFEKTTINIWKTIGIFLLLYRLSYYDEL